MTAPRISRSNAGTDYYSEKDPFDGGGDCGTGISLGEKVGSSDVWLRVELKPRDAHPTEVRWLVDGELVGGGGHVYAQCPNRLPAGAPHRYVLSKPFNGVSIGTHYVQAETTVGLGASATIVRSAATAVSFRCDPGVLAWWLAPHGLRIAWSAPFSFPLLLWLGSGLRLRGPQLSRQRLARVSGVTAASLIAFGFVIGQFHLWPPHARLVWIFALGSLAILLWLAAGWTLLHSDDARRFARAPFLLMAPVAVSGAVVLDALRSPHWEMMLADVLTHALSAGAIFAASCALWPARERGSLSLKDKLAALFAVGAGLLGVMT